jgi:hypothetical protein
MHLRKDSAEDLRERGRELGLRVFGACSSRDFSD